MWLLLLSVAAASPVAVDVAGMAPQLAIIRRDAAERGWRISCEGRSGEEGTLRLAFPPDVRRESVEAYFDPNHYVGSSAYFYSRADELPEHCDHDPTRIISAESSQVLAAGPRDTLAPLVGLARDCGFGAALVRERREADIQAEAGAMPGDWLILDAGEDVVPRYGPALCFLNLHRGRLSSASEEAR